MLGALKEKFQLIQNDLSTGLRQFRNKRRLAQQRSSQGASINFDILNPDAGAELLNNYMTTWQDIHEATAENIEKAETADSELARLQATAEKKCEDFIQLQQGLRSINIISDEISTLINETVKLEGLCEEVESALAYLDVICHTEQTQSAKLEQRFQLALHRERKVAQLNEVKTQITNEFLVETENVERRRLRQQADKVKMLQEVMEKDFQAFKTSGIVSNSLAGVHIISNNLDTPRTSRSIDDDANRLAEYSPQLSDLEAFEDFLADASSAGRTNNDEGVPNDNRAAKVDAR